VHGIKKESEHTHERQRLQEGNQIKSPIPSHIMPQPQFLFFSEPKLLQPIEAIGLFFFLLSRLFSVSARKLPAPCGIGDTWEYRGDVFSPDMYVCACVGSGRFAFDVFVRALLFIIIIIIIIVITLARSSSYPSSPADKCHCTPILFHLIHHHNKTPPANLFLTPQMIQSHPCPPNVITTTTPPPPPPGLGRWQRHEALLTDYPFRVGKWPGAGVGMVCH
jgi:hypothetical protein